MAKVELLAPCGSVEAFYQAIEAGADAVYLGGMAFNARMFAQNMDMAKIQELVQYAHVRDVKVYATLNTIVFASEWDNLKQFIDELYHAGCDALIIQDLGIAHYVRLHYPDFPLHASTQMNIHTLAGVQELKKLGFERVILAREVDLDLIKEMTQVGIEIEVFVHGALCFSHSGNCYLSSSIGPRSGNRGQCAQPCRKKYQLYRGNTLIADYQALLSMKDLMTLEYMKDLIEAGITSFKIEGRMKRPDYVYTTVSSYRRVIDQILANESPEISEATVKALKLSFNREFTKGYLLGEKNHLLTNTEQVNHQGIPIGKVIKQTPFSLTISLTEPLYLQEGIRISDEENNFGFIVTQMFVDEKQVKFAKPGDKVTLPVKPQTSKGAIVLKTYSAKAMEANIELPKRFIPITGYLKIQGDQPLLLSVSDDLHTVEVKGEVVTTLAEKPQSTERFLAQIQKTGDTPFTFTKLNHDIDSQYYVAIQALNQLRRDALLKLTDLRSKQVNRYELPYQLITKDLEPISPSASLEVLVTNLEQYQVAKELGINVIYYDIPDFEPNDTGAIPVLQRISDDNQNQYPSAMVHHLAQLTSTKQPIISPYFNLVNHDGLNFVKHYGVNKAYLSFESSLEEVKEIVNHKPSDMELGYLVYGKYDTMITSHCPIAKALGFDHKHCQVGCRMRYHLHDEFHNKMPLITTPDCHVRILSHQVINLIDYLNDLRLAGISRFLLVFTLETNTETQPIIASFQKVLNGEKIKLNIPNSTIAHFKERVG